MRVIDYLDTEGATKRILRGWYDRVFKSEHNKERIELIRTRLLKTTGGTDSSPVKGGTSSKEDQWINGLDAIDRLEREMFDADEVQCELEICWNRLTEDERFLLREMYVDNEDRRGIERIKETLHVEKSEAYARARRALARLAKLLYW